MFWAIDINRKYWCFLGSHFFYSSYLLISYFNQISILLNLKAYLMSRFFIIMIQTRKFPATFTIVSREWTTINAILAESELL